MTNWEPNFTYHTKQDLFSRARPHCSTHWASRARRISNIHHPLWCLQVLHQCLPSHIFELVEFSGSLFDDGTLTTFRNDAVYKVSCMNTLCTQIVVKQPLALALAKTVKACCFTCWTLNELLSSWALRLFEKKKKKSIHGMSQMINIRQLEFFKSFMDTEHWNVIATLGSREELSFDWCNFLDSPTDVEPDERVKIKLARLHVTDCEGVCQPIAATNPRYLHILGMDQVFFEEVNWLPQSALTELYFWTHGALNQVWCIEQLHTILTQVPKSLKVIWLYVNTSAAQEIFGRMFDDPEWKNLPLICTLTLEVLVGSWLDQVCQSSLSNLIYWSWTHIPVHFLSLGECQ